MSFAIKQPATGDNSTPVSDPNSESSHREYTPGKFYDGNHTKNRQEDICHEGSEGLARNQGHIIDSFIPTVDKGGDKGQNNTTRLKEQGSHAHFGYKESKVAREI